MKHKGIFEIPNGVSFIEDISGAMPPMPFTDEKIQWNSKCIAVACMQEQFGTTEVVIGPTIEVALDRAPVFDGHIQTPSRAIMIANVPGEALLKAGVPAVLTQIQIWTNHPNWPDQVVVGWG